MASTTLSATTPSQLCSGKSGIFCPSRLKCTCCETSEEAYDEKGMRISCQATSIPADRVPADMGKRQLMNLLLLGAISLPTAGIPVPYTYYFVPPGSGSSAGGTVAKDAIGNDVITKNWLAHGPGDRPLTQVLKANEILLQIDSS